MIGLEMQHGICLWNKLIFSIKTRLVELGHDEKDIRPLKTMSAVDKDTELTDRSMLSRMLYSSVLTQFRRIRLESNSCCN